VPFVLTLKKYIDIVLEELEFLF